MTLRPLTLALLSLLPLVGCAEDILPLPGGSGGGDSSPSPDSIGPTDLDPGSTDQPVVAKEATSLADLVARIAPEFAAAAHPELELIEPLEKAETISFDKFKHVQDPTSAAKTNAEDERLKTGASCSALYHGFMTFRSDSFWLGLYSIKDTVRYGVHEVDREDLVRKKLADVPAFASLAYQETTKSYSNENGKRITSVYIGTSGDKTLVAQTVRDETDDGVDYENCVKVFDSAKQSIDVACSRAYNTPEAATRTDWNKWETAEGGFYKSRTNGLEVATDGEEVSYSSSFEQKSPEVASFEQDFRKYYTSADAGIFFGGLYPPYAYASGDLTYSFEGEGESRRVSDCKVSSVTIKTE